MNTQVVKFENLHEFCLQFKKKLKLNTIFILTGEMGAGKTTFIKHLFPELSIISPTFLNAIEYENLMHIDAYSIDKRKLLTLNLEEILEKKFIIIEWGELIKQELENFLCNIETIHLKRIETNLYITF